METTSSDCHPLSLKLREETSSLHIEVERKPGLPHSIANVFQYRESLSRFYGFYRPLEALFARFGDWPGIGIVLHQRYQSSRLALDLRVLGVSLKAIEDAPPCSLPRLLDFASALGTMYVLEGSTLGAQVLLPCLRSTLGEDIAGAELFFGGNGSQSRLLWQQFCASLDLYGKTHPADVGHVVDGARATFNAIGNWMQS